MNQLKYTSTSYWYTTAASIKFEGRGSLSTRCLQWMLAFQQPHLLCKGKIRSTNRIFHGNLILSQHKEFSRQQFVRQYASSSYFQTIQSRSRIMPRRICHYYSPSSTIPTMKYDNEKDNIGETVPSKQSITNHLLYSHKSNNKQQEEDHGASSPTSTIDDSPNIYNILLSSVGLLEQYDAPEPTSSACHLLAHALPNQFTWEDNGFHTLLQLLEVDPTSMMNNSNLSENNRSSSSIVVLGQTKVTKEEYNNMAQMIQRRIQKEPLQYILGKWDFYDFTIHVRRPCLCPRPETEELVEYVAKDIRSMLERIKLQEEYQRAIIRGGKCDDNEDDTNSPSPRKLRVLDVGCGTGVIGIALLRMFPTQIEVYAIDVSSDAIQLSRENGDLVLGTTLSSLSYHTIKCSADAFTNQKCEEGSKTYDFGFDLVVSNPPYIPKNDMSTLSDDVVNYEDDGALCGGDDGMDVIRDIVKRLPEWCRTTTSNINAKKSSVLAVNDMEPTCWMEVDTTHPERMKRWLSESNADDTFISEAQSKQDSLHRYVVFEEGIEDFRGLARFVKLRISGSSS